MNSIFTKLAYLSALSLGISQASTLFMGAYPNSILVFDEAQGKVVEHIPLATGLPTSMRLSADKKTLYVTTNDNSGVEVIDVATRKVTNHFVLNSPTKRFRFNGGTPDPSGKLLYTTTTEIDKLVDHFEIGKLKYTVIDLEQQKIVKTVDVPTADATGMGRGGFEISPDGKYLFLFRQNIIVLSTDDFKEVARIDLSKPDLPSMENIGFGGQLDSFRDPGQHISLFNSSDPIVHNRVFGIGRFDLTTRQMDFTPIGPSPSSMAGLQVTADKKDAYTVVSTGDHGNKRCEFWHFDLTTNKLASKAEFACRTRFSFGMSGDSKKLYIYGANFEIEVFDAATLKYEKTWDLNNDITMAGLVIVD
jgi:DNA-binding beta-propeller fold protein YncE